MMIGDRDEIVCFKHCDENRAIFSDKIINVEERRELFCPLCKSEVRSYVSEPFRVPCPFGEASQRPFTIAIRPSTGSFLEDYQIGDDLHIAVVDSEGKIFEFDHRGVSVSHGGPDWRLALSVPTGLASSWSARWDELLVLVSRESRSYHPTSSNCFDFVYDFLRKLEWTPLVFDSKELLCRELILPKLREALKYALLYRKVKLQASRCYVVPPLIVDED